MTYFNITSDAYAIMQIQRILRDLELLDNEYSSVPISGVYDGETREAVAEFQAKYELEPTGIVDYETWSPRNLTEEVQGRYSLCQTEVDLRFIPTKLTI